MQNIGRAGNDIGRVRIDLKYWMSLVSVVLVYILVRWIVTSKR